MELWRVVENWEFYDISDIGRVRSRDRTIEKSNGLCRLKGKVLSGKNADGYATVTLSMAGRRRTVQIHILVANAFLGPRPSGMEVCHRDGDRTNPALKNLRYGTPVSNAADKQAHGTVFQGERHANAKLTEAQVLEARRLRGVETQASLAERFGVKMMAISRAQRKVSWAHVE